MFECTLPLSELHELSFTVREEAEKDITKAVPGEGGVSSGKVTLTQTAPKGATACFVKPKCGEETDKMMSASQVSNNADLSRQAVKMSRTEDFTVDSYGNFRIQVKSWNVEVDRYGRSGMMGEDEIVLAIFLEGHHIGDMSLGVRNIKNILSCIQAKYPQVRANARIKGIKGILENSVRAQLNAGIKSFRYTQAGWNIYRGRRIYLHKDSEMPECFVDTEQSLPYKKDTDGSELIDIWKRMLSLYRRDDLSFALSLFALSGVLYRLFEEAGHPIRTVLYITGKTGSFKTEISKILFTQLSTEEYRGHPRRIDFGTRASLERSLILEGTDTVTLFDDVSPAKTSTAHSTIQNNLELILRMVGDGSTKSRSNGKLENIRGEGVHGTVVVTGEVMASGLSSNLRCLYLYIEKNLVNLNRLTWFQENPLAICTLIFHFTNFLSRNWKRILAQIAEDFSSYRSAVFRNLTSGRLADCYAHLNLIADVMKEFLQDYCFAEPELLDSLFKDQQKKIWTIVQNSERLTEESDPADVFIDALLLLLEEKEFFLVDRKHLADNPDADGFYDKGFLYIREQACYLKTVNWITKSKISFSFDLRQVERMLCESDYIIPAPNGGRKVTYCSRILIGKTKINFLKFREDRLRDFYMARGNGSANVDEWE